MPLPAETLQETDPEARAAEAAPSPWNSPEERRAYYAEAAAMASPARRLQADLASEFDREWDAERWPLRRSVALVFTTCGAFWTLVYFIVAALIG
jgi:hypothetical protein